MTYKANEQECDLAAEGKSLKCSLLLPHLSPLSDRTKLCPSRETARIVKGLEKTGYSADWSHGTLHVSPPPTPQIRPHTSYEHSSDHRQSPFQPRQSFVTFAKAPARIRTAQTSVSTSSISLSESGTSSSSTTERQRFQKVPTVSQGAAIRTTCVDSSRVPPAPPPIPVTRGHILIVFDAIDRQKRGRLTFSEFEDAAVSLGFSLDQVQRMFNMLDQRGKGYVVLADWGQKEREALTRSFSSLYMRKFMGMPGAAATPEQVKRYIKRQRMREVKALMPALNMLRVNSVARGSRSASGGDNAIFEAFRFIDADGSGDLSREELQDGFSALGVLISEEVLHQILHMFDVNGNGRVDYYEFVHAMFPRSPH